MTKVCDVCKQKVERTYILVLYACGLRFNLCEKCYSKALGKVED